MTNGVYYFWYEWSKAAFAKAAQGRKQMNVIESLMAGALAGSATVFVTNPIWVVNSKQITMAADEAEHQSSRDLKSKKVRRPGTIEVFLNTLQKEGFWALWAGVIPALVLVINPIIQYMIYEQLKNTIEQTRKLTSRDAFYLGALGKIIATTFTYPYITIKSRMQTKREYKNIGALNGLSKIMKDEGLSGIYGGLGSKLTQSVLTAAFLFAFKEQLYEVTRSALINLSTRRKRVIS